MALGLGSEFMVEESGVYGSGVEFGFRVRVKDGV